MSSSTLPNLNITGNNTAKFIGEVYAPNTTVSVVSGATYTMNNGNLFTVNGTGGFTNAGTLGVAAGGTGTITGNYTQASSGTFSPLVTDNTIYGKLVVTGTATLSHNANIYVNVANPAFSFSATSMNSIISAGTLTSDGTFATTTNANLFNFTAVKNGNHVDLTIAAGTSGSGGTPGVLDAVIAQGNTPGEGAARELDTLIASDPNGPVSKLFQGITGGNRVTSADVTATLPLLSGGMAHATSGNLHEVNRVVQARQDENNSGMSSGDDFVTSRNAWVKPLGSWANQSDANGASGYKAKTAGIVLGLDKSLSSITRLGAAFALTHSNINNNLGSQSAGVDSYQAVLYGSRSLDDKRTEFNWQANYGTNQNTSNRNLAFLNRNAAASYTSNSFHLGAGVGRMLAINEKTSFTPSFRADYTSIHNNGYTETGSAGALNLAVSGQTTNEFILAVDGKVSYALSDTSTLTANLGVGYDTMAKQSSITAAYAGGGAAFTTMGINPSPAVVNGGVGVVMKSSKTVEVTGRYDIEARTGFIDQTVSVKARWPF